MPAGVLADGAIWENVASRTMDDGRLGWGLVALFVLAGVIAAVAILLDSAPMIVGAMAVSPDFGPSRRSRSASCGGGRTSRARASSRPSSGSGWRSPPHSWLSLRSV